MGLYLFFTKGGKRYRVAAVEDCEHEVGLEVAPTVMMTEGGALELLESAEKSGITTDRRHLSDLLDAKSEHLADVRKLTDLA